MAVLHSEEEIARRLAEAQQEAADTTSEETEDTSPQRPKRFPLSSTVVESLVGFIRNPTERWYLGFPEFDLATRGIGRGEVMMVI